MEDPTIYNVRAVERAIHILLCFDDEHPERGVSEIAQLTGLHKATAHRIIVTLYNGGLLERLADGEKYRLGTRVAKLGLSVLRRLDFRQEALPHMQRLVERFQETCDLGVYDNGQVLCVAMVPGSHLLTVSVRVGHHLPIHCTASGKVLLAFLPPEIVEPLMHNAFEAHTERTITEPSRLREELQITRQRGYALDDGEFENGIRAISAPIRDLDGHVVATISIPGPAERLTLERIPEIAEALVETAHAVSARGLVQGL